MRQTLQQLLDGDDLTVNQAESLLRALTDDAVEPALKGALLAALRAKGETAIELRGMALAMRAAARTLPIGPSSSPLVDTCGTGGDGSSSINISTAAALVVAAAGGRVVKHGNRTVSSRSGSADVLEKLGINLPPSPKAAAELLERSGFTFLFAPVFHPSMKAVVPVRRAMKVRTVFNLLGPLTNPAAPPYQVIGVFHPAFGKLMAEALSGMPIQRAVVVHGHGGWDEATPMGPFHAWSVTPGKVDHAMVDPLEAYGIPRCKAEDLAGGSADENADALRRIFAGEMGPPRDAVLLNAALALEVAGLAGGQGAVEMGAKALDSGAVMALLKRAR